MESGPLVDDLPMTIMLEMKAFPIGVCSFHCYVTLPESRWKIHEHYMVVGDEFHKLLKVKAYNQQAYDIHQDMVFWLDPKTWRIQLS